MCENFCEVCDCETEEEFTIPGTTVCFDCYEKYQAGELAFDAETQSWITVKKSGQENS